MLKPAALPYRPNDLQCRTIVGVVEPEFAHRLVSYCLKQGDDRSDRAIITPARQRTLIPIKVPLRTTNRPVRISD
jgi:hypothetical protein